MRQGGISWRYVLWCFAELKEDEWITAKNFISLFNIPLLSFYRHVHLLKGYGLIHAKYIKLNEGVISTNENRVKEYQITRVGKTRTDRWIKLNQGFSKWGNRINCPKCGFSMSMDEFKFIDEVVNKKGRS